MELPRQYKGKQLVSAAPFWYQSLHKQKTAFSVYMGVTGWDAYAPIATGKSSNWMNSIACMRKGGVRWLMIHKEWFAERARGEQIEASIKLKPVANDGERILYDLSQLSISPQKDVYLPPRNTSLPKEKPKEVVLDVDIFAMQQFKCPIDSAAQHHLEP